jgi:hypothetical protein
MLKIIYNIIFIPYCIVLPFRQCDPDDMPQTALSLVCGYENPAFQAGSVVVNVIDCF